MDLFLLNLLQTDETFSFSVVSGDLKMKMKIVRFLALESMFSSYIHALDLAAFMYINACNYHNKDLLITAGSAGTFSRVGVPPGRYVLRTEIRDFITKERKLMATVIQLDPSVSFCTTYLINRGLGIEGRTVTVEFTATGQHNGFTCSLNGHETFCKLIMFCCIL